MFDRIVGKNGDRTLGRNSSLEQRSRDGVNERPRFSPCDLTPCFGFPLRQKDLIGFLRSPPFQIFAQTPWVRTKRLGRAQDDDPTGPALDVDACWQKSDHAINLPSKTGFRRGAYNI